MHDDANLRGWALLQKPDRTRDDLEDALRCFETAAGNGSLPAVSNLGDALLALDRADDALVELDRLSHTEDALAARAHNWLGWYFQAGQLDLARSISHLDHATRLAPEWGVGWLNLAKAHDAGGDLQSAATAYGKAIECSNSHDDTFARDRRLQLEMTLLGRGEPPPPAPPTAVADSRGFEIVRETAARLATPHAFMIRPTQRAGGRVMPAIIGTIVEGRAIGACIVDSRLHALRRDGDVLAFVESPDLLPWLSALDPAVVSPIDVAMWIFDKLKEADWSWAVTAARPAAITLWPCGLEVCARDGGGVSIRVGRAAFEVTTVAAALELEGPLRAAIADERARLHAGDLREGGRYRVLEAFGTLVRDEVATIVDHVYSAYDGISVFEFRGDRGGDARLQDYRDDAILGEIDRYLARHA